MKNVVVILVALIAVNVGTIGLAGAQAIPKSGSFSIHSGWKSTGEMMQVAENHASGSFIGWGVTYNDKGRGLLHHGAAMCPYHLDIINGAGTARGTCAWGDTDGDKIFTEWTGSLTPAGEFSGLNQITGGTGKFSGIDGKAPFQCKGLGANAQLTCVQQFEYRLP
jgi:hypothetical protein